MKFAYLLLLCSIAPLQAEMNTGAEALAKAAITGDVTTIQSLLDAGIDPDLPDQYGAAPLYHAVSFNERDVVAILLAHHADPNIQRNSRKSEFPVTPLQYAAYLGNVHIASMLIAAGARVNTKGPTGRTALHFAVLATHLDVMRYLLEKGADLNTRDTDGTSPLDDAVWRGYLDAVAILLANGARLNEAEPNTGATPINEAAYRGNTRLVKYLLQFSSDLAIPDKNGYRPLENAARRGKEDSALLLLEAEAKRQKAPVAWEKTMDAAIAKDESALVQALVRDGISPNAPLGSGLTPLDAAASAASTNTVRVLLDNGADPNTQNRNGISPLQDSSLRGFEQIVTLLLDHGAQVNQISADSGTTALYAAASFGKGDVVNLLLNRGADPNLCGKGAKTPYQAALENGYGEIAAQIQNHGGTASCRN